MSLITGVDIPDVHFDTDNGLLPSLDSRADPLSSWDWHNGPETTVFSQRPTKYCKISLDIHSVSDAQCDRLRQWLLMEGLESVSAVREWPQKELALGEEQTPNISMGSEFIQTDQSQAQVLAYVATRAKRGCELPARRRKDQGRYQCTSRECTYRTDSASSWKRHRQARQPNKIFRCSECHSTPQAITAERKMSSKLFMTHRRDHFGDHLSGCHPDRNADEAIDRSTHNIAYPNGFQCGFCGEIFTPPQSSRNHVQTAKKFENHVIEHFDKKMNNGEEWIVARDWREPWCRKENDIDDYATSDNGGVRDGNDGCDGGDGDGAHPCYVNENIQTEIKPTHETSNIPWMMQQPHDWSTYPFHGDESRNCVPAHTDMLNRSKVSFIGPPNSAQWALQNEGNEGNARFSWDRLSTELEAFDLTEHDEPMAESMADMFEASQILEDLSASKSYIANTSIQVTNSPPLKHTTSPDLPDLAGPAPNLESSETGIQNSSSPNPMALDASISEVADGTVRQRSPVDDLTISNKCPPNAFDGIGRATQRTSSIDHYLGDRQKYVPGLSTPRPMAEDVPPVLSDHFTCEHCTKAFPSKNALNGHLRAHANNQGRHKACLHCNARFRLYKDLQRHMLKHKGHRPVDKYLCPGPRCRYYDKGFARKDHFKRHLLQHYPKLKDAGRGQELNQLVDACAADSQRRKRAEAEADEKKPPVVKNEPSDIEDKTSVFAALPRFEGKVEQ